MNATFDQNWPSDADGDVLRRMLSHGFDFSSPASIDFNIDFDGRWPPPEELIAELGKSFAEVTIHEPGEYSGYVSFVVTAQVTHELVMFIQSSVSELAAPFGGICESWGVPH